MARSGYRTVPSKFNGTRLISWDAKQKTHVAYEQIND